MTETAETQPPHKEPSLARVQALPWLIVIALIALAAWLAQQAFFADREGDPLGATLVAFEKQNKLTVFSAELAPVVSAEDSRLMGLVTSKQIAVIPARVDYTIDLSGIDRSDLGWDGPTETLTVRLPDVTAGKPNLDEARAQYLREGIWISRDAQDSLSRKNTRLAEDQALKQATTPVLMGLAKNAAKDAIRQNLAIPLSVAGYDNVKVEVYFQDEAVDMQPASPSPQVSPTAS